MIIKIPWKWKIGLNEVDVWFQGETKFGKKILQHTFGLRKEQDRERLNSSNLNILTFFSSISFNRRYRSINRTLHEYGCN